MSRLFSRRKFASPTTNHIFPREVQHQMFEVASAKKFDTHPSRYWLTLSQAVRLCGTDVKPRQMPSSILIGSQHVFPLPNGADTSKFLAQNPPYFGMGVGLFTKGKWKKVTSPPLVNLLNPNRENRKLYIDEDDAEHAALPLNPSTAVQVDSLSRVRLYHASQMLHPERCAPPRGLALNAATGRRWPQPAHDVLLAAAILCGHTSPMWCTTKQATKLFQVQVTKPENAVRVSTRVGHAILLSALPPALQNEVTARLAPPSGEECKDTVYMLDMGNWERVDHPRILRQMTSISTSKLLWVTRKELVRMGIDTDNVAWNSKTTVNLASLTTETFHNALDTSDPLCVQPRDRPFVLVDGRTVCPAFSDVLLKTTAARGYLSPLWLTSRQMASIGVAPLPGQKPVILSAGQGAAEFYYNLEDVVGYETWLQQNPPIDSLDVHQVFLVNWRPVISKGKTSTFTSFGRCLKLWISATELLISGLELRDSAKKYKILSGQVGRRKIMGKRSEQLIQGREVYNAMQTTDPIRVMGVSHYLSRIRK